MPSSLKVFDATCPLVTKVHMEVLRYAKRGQECILIGHEGHPEVEGTMGRYDTSHGGKIYLVEDEQDVANLVVNDPSVLAFVTQTTLSMDDTAKVIDALREKFPEIQGPRKDDICYATQNRQDAVRELAADRWLEGVKRIGVTAGASAPEVLVKGVIDQLQALGAEAPVELQGREETITFSMPKELRERVIVSE